MHDDPAMDPVPHVPDRREAVTLPTFAAAHRPPAVDPARSVDPRICPFLRAVDDQERLDQPLEIPHPINRCAALSEPVPQSLRQQELVCLTSGHVNCPRYLRGSLGTAPARVRVRADLPVQVSSATAGALAVLVLAFATSVGFVVANGGLVLSAAATAAPSGDVLGEVVTPPPASEPVATPSPAASPTPSPTPLPTPTAQPTPTASPLPTPTAKPTPTPTAEPTARPRPTSDRYALLKPCPDRSGCWIYRIRSGDNLYSITNYFGVSFQTVKAWNPWTDNGLKVGRELRIPTPTR